MRRAPNPLTRNYESSGPDVKIRGNAQHIADKYLVLARDAQASGDRVMGENYLQHAEHYTRIILSAQAHENNARVSRHDNEYKAEERVSAPQTEADDSDDAPQPVIEGIPGEVTLTGRNGGYRSEPQQAADADENEARRPRRRLPARRARAETADEAYAERPRRAPGNSEAGAEAEGTGARPARARRPRRVKPAEAEQAGNL